MAGNTFQKRQKEMKRQEKQRMKAERRAQRKIEKSLQADGAGSAEVSQVSPDDQNIYSDSFTNSDSPVK